MNLLDPNAAMIAAVEEMLATTVDEPPRAWPNKMEKVLNDLRRAGLSRKKARRVLIEAFHFWISVKKGDFYESIRQATKPRKKHSETASSLSFIFKK